MILSGDRSGDEGFISNFLIFQSDAPEAGWLWNHCRMGAYGAQADPFVKPFSPERVAGSTDNAFESAAAPR